MPRPKTFDEDETLTRIGTLFWQQGFSATSMGEIAERVGLKKTSIYNAYGDKAAHFRKVVDWYVADMLAEAEIILKGATRVSEELTELMLCFLVLPEEDVVSRGCLITNGMLELRHTEPELYDYVRDRFQRISNGIAGYIEIAQTAGRLDKSADPCALAAFFMTVFQGMRVQTRIQNDSTYREQIIHLATAPIRAVETEPHQTGTELGIRMI